MAGKRGRLIEVEAIFGRLLALPDDLITNQILKFGAHARPELAILLSMIASGDSVFDLGAHIGTFAIPIAQKVGPTGRVLAIEALPRTFRVLQRNLRKNRVDQIAEAVNALVAPPGLRYAPVRNRGNSGGTRFEPTEEANASSEGVGIDTLCERYFHPRVIKIDVEGLDLPVLAGSQMIQDTRPILYAEVSARGLRKVGKSIDEFNELLQSRDYRLFRNMAPRNASSDAFEIRELAHLGEGGDFFDVLAIHRLDERLESLAHSDEI
ncbi:MAG TPA: FkbM family methyltransferase [Rhizomicrobium sp.]|jgi:FkbM family methyltransferase|nr:FkbM family methyltransferase [Rhizomicrobium sp.]